MMPQYRFKYVVFDVNGTLFDDVEIGLESCNRMLEYYGRPRISLKSFQDTFTTPWIEFYKINGVPLEHIDIPTHQRLYQEANKKLVEKYLDLREHTFDILRYLKDMNLKLGVLSSRNINDLSDELRQTKIYDFFHAVIGEDHLYEDGTQSEKKTDRLIEDLGIIQPSEVLYIGDMIPDIKIAKAHGFVSGVIVGGWQSEKRLRAENPDHILYSMLEIKNLLL